MKEGTSGTDFPFADRELADRRLRAVLAHERTLSEICDAATRI